MKIFLHFQLQWGGVLLPHYVLKASIMTNTLISERYTGFLDLRFDAIGVFKGVSISQLLKSFVYFWFEFLGLDVEGQ